MNDNVIPLQSLVEAVLEEWKTITDCEGSQQSKGPLLLPMFPRTTRTLQECLDGGERVLYIDARSLGWYVDIGVTGLIAIQVLAVEVVPEYDESKPWTCCGPTRFVPNDLTHCLRVSLVDQNLCYDPDQVHELWTFAGMTVMSLDSQLVLECAAFQQSA